MAKIYLTEDTPPEEESYFLSMTDMMVGLLFIFILMLMHFALQFHKTTQQQQQVIEQLTGAQQTRSEILQKIKDTLYDLGFDVTVDQKSGVLHLQEKALRFASGDALIDSQYQPIVNALANSLGTILPCYANQRIFDEKKCVDNNNRHWIEAIFIEGHTDNVPYVGGNLRLSTERATNTYASLVAARPDIEQLKNPDEQSLLSVSGYGETRPISDNSTAEARKKNRRIDLRIIMAMPKTDKFILQTVIDDLDKGLQ